MNQVIGDIVARNENDRSIDTGLCQALSLEVDHVRIVDFKIGNAWRLLAHRTGVEACAEDDDLPAAVN